jgi:hypothetical protein
MVGRLGLLAVAALLFSAADHVEAQMDTQNGSGVFSLGVAGVATPQPSTLSVSAPLANITNRSVADVKIDRIKLAGAPAETPLPIAVGAVGARSSVIVQAQFNGQSLRGGQRYELVMQGTYRGQKGKASTFNVHSFVAVPPSEGSGRVGTTQAPAQKVEGGRYPPQPPRMGNDVNSGAPPVPTNPEVPGAPAPAGTEAKSAPK